MTRSGAASRSSPSLDSPPRRRPMRPRRTNTVPYSTLLAIRTLARRVAYLDAELVELNRVIKPLI
jgi:hypothetical protein